jgi:hypothetical protein
VSDDVSRAAEQQAREERENALYIARDIAVLERAFPDLTPERAAITTERAEYEASFVLHALRRAAGDRTLPAIMRDGLTSESDFGH